MKKLIWVIAFLTLVLATYPLTASAEPFRAGWRAEYYDNPALHGQPVLSRVDADVNHDWGLGSPALEIPDDHFSARWTTRRHFEAGTYLFFLTVDDGARIWLDGNLIVDAWDVGYKEKIQNRIRFDQSGEHEIQVAYFEDVGKAMIKLETLKLGGEDDIVNAWVGEYFNNRNLEGSPVFVRQDGGIRFDWGLGAPADKIAKDNFSIRWTRSIYLREGWYHFRVQHDDGMRIYVDGKIIYESWYDQEVSYRTGMVPLKGGYRTFVIEYYDHVGNAVAQLSFDEDPGNYDQDDSANIGVIVDNTSSRFSWSGPNRIVSGGGYDGDFYWTNSGGATEKNSAKWTAPIGAAGNYEVYAYIPAAHSSTSRATYRIYHFDRVASRTINQSAYSNQFVSLGIYYFDGNANECVILGDATGEGAGSTQIAFDALKFVQR